MTGKAIAGDNRRYYPIRGAQFTWWYCCDCQGWHASIIDTWEKIPAFDNAILI